MIGRREFITVLGGAAAAWPFAAGGQHGERMRRIGVLSIFAADNPEGQRRLAAFLQALQPLGWMDGRNLQVDYRWGMGDTASTRKNGAELIALRPDVILTSNAAGVEPLLQATHLFHTRRVRLGRRSSWRGLCGQPRAARRQCNRLHSHCNTCATDLCDSI
jgi:hypothetical protein